MFTSGDKLKLRGQSKQFTETSNIDTADFCIFSKMSKLFKDFKLG